MGSGEKRNLSPGEKIIDVASSVIAVVVIVFGVVSIGALITLAVWALFSLAFG